jgi:hypothetical protein
VFGRFSSDSRRQRNVCVRIHLSSRGGVPMTALTLTCDNDGGSKMRGRGKLALAAGVMVAVTGAATASFAAWSSTGTGSGTAQATHDLPSHITAAASAPAFYPGAIDTVTVTIDNPNPYPVIVTGIAAAQAPAVNGGACAANTVFTDGVSNAAGVPQSGGTLTVIAARGTGVYAIAGHMIGSAADACKDQSFPLTLTATLQSAAS